PDTDRRRARKREGLPVGSPSIVETVVAGLRGRAMRQGPRTRRGSSSVPATAARDNETLDHLLSVVDDSCSLTGIARRGHRLTHERRDRLPRLPSWHRTQRQPFGLMKVAK